MTVIDSRGWLHYFTGGSLAEAFTPVTEQTDLLVPALVIYEVYRALKRDVSEAAATEAAGHLATLTVATLDTALATDAADLGLAHHLATADAIIYATAQAHGATLVTCDKHFAGLPGVDFIAPSGQ